MNNIGSFIGFGVAVITPFNNQNKIDTEALANITDYLIKGGVDYLVVLGTTAETPTLNIKEKQEILDIVITKNAKRVPIMVGLSSNNTLELLHEIEAFNFEGVDAILSSTPYYNKPSQEGILAHFTAIANAAPRPLLLYNVPGRAGVNMSVSTIATLSQHKNIFGIKEASGDINHIGSIIKATAIDPSFLIISGDDGLTLPTIALGGKGVISVLGNAYPATWSKMVKLALTGNFASARTIHFDYLETIEAIFEDGNPAGIKALLSELNLCKNILRLPLVAVQKNTQIRIKRIANSHSELN